MLILTLTWLSAVCGARQWILGAQFARTRSVYRNNIGNTDMSSEELEEHEYRSETVETTVEVGGKTKLQQINKPIEEHDQLLEDSGTEEYLTLAAEPKLDLSRDQTPEAPDEAMSTYTDLAPGSPSAGEEEGSKRRLAPALDIDRAVVKRTRTDEDGGSSEYPPLVVKETQTKKITAKSIEKQWVNFENESFQSFEKLCAMATNSVLERFQNSRQRDTQVVETQRILIQHWLSSKLPKSFLTRLKVTKVPPPKTLVVRLKGVRDGNFDPLSIDQVNLRKTVFETYLLAEEKQLESLVAYRSSLQDTYNLDLAYLNDFKKTTANLRAKMSQERTENSKKLHLEPKKDKILDIRLRPKTPSVNTATLAQARFDPDQDDDLKPLLADIRNDVSRLDSRKQDILDLCDQLDIIECQLFTRKAKGAQ